MQVNDIKFLLIIPACIHNLIYLFNKWWYMFLFSNFWDKKSFLIREYILILFYLLIGKFFN